MTKMQKLARQEMKKYEQVKHSLEFLENEIRTGQIDESKSKADIICELLETVELHLGSLEAHLDDLINDEKAGL